MNKKILPILLAVFGSALLFFPLTWLFWGVRYAITEPPTWADLGGLMLFIPYIAVAMWAAFASLLFLGKKLVAKADK
jgi:hypothetical protein